MHIRTKLSLLFTALTGAILLLFSLFIYFDAESERENEFFRSLVKEAVTKANLILDAKVDPETLQTIYMENREILREVEVAIYDLDFNLLYHDAVEIDIVKETEEMIDEIVNEGEISFTQNGWQVIGVLFYYEDEPFVITAASHDKLGYRKLNRMRNTLFFSWVVAIGIFYFIGVFFSRHALLPFANINKKINEITATNLDLRLEKGKTNDELTQLTANFNAMLDRLEKSFSSQKDFIHAISHEIRTPLAAIIAEIELGLEKEELGKKDHKMLNR
ncbi:MAG: HAMP domain-containing protein, partial [Saprospirales bacterium]